MAYRTVSLILTLPNFSWRSGCLQSFLNRRIERASTELFKVSCAVVCSELSMRSATTLRMPLARSRFVLLHCRKKILPFFVGLVWLRAHLAR